MDEYKRIYVPLSRDEFIALSQVAQGELRHPREQARFILRAVLLGEQNASALTNEKSDAIRQDAVAFTQ